MTVKVPLLDLKAQHASIREEVRAAIDRVVESQHFILGPEVAQFERAVAAYSGCAAAVGVSSGTDAILLALMALPIAAGDEVITSASSFIATASSIARLGAKPVFVDIDPLTYNLDPSKLAGAITARTRAIMPVHLFGQVAAMEPILEVAGRRGIPVIEDAAQAIGAEAKGKRAGTFGAMSCLSFFPTKNLGAFGDAGAVLTNDPDLERRLRLLRVQGQEPKYFCKSISGNFRLDALQAAVLGVKLRHLDDWTAARQRNAARYRTLFAEAGVDSALTRPTAAHPVTLPQEAAGVRHIYHQFVIRSLRREELRASLQAQGIGAEVYYPRPMHLQECFAPLGHRLGDFPEAEAAANESLAIPIYPELTLEMQQAVVGAISGFHRR